MQIFLVLFVQLLRYQCLLLSTEDIISVKTLLLERHIAGKFFSTI